MLDFMRTQDAFQEMKLSILSNKEMGPELTEMTFYNHWDQRVLLTSNRNSLKAWRQRGDSNTVFGLDFCRNSRTGCF